MGKNIIKVKRFKLPPYSINIIFVYSNSYNEIIKFAEDEKFHITNIEPLTKKDYSGYSMFIKDYNEVPYHYIIIKKGKDRYEDIDIITHEMAHAVKDILDYFQIKYTKTNDEPFAYLIGYLNKEFFKFKDGVE